MYRKPKDEISVILAQYHIVPNYFETVGKVVKIYTNQGVFALKEANVNRVYRNNLIDNVRSLQDKGFRNVVPIYHTQSGDYIVEFNTKHYYLMPWIESVDEKSDENLHFQRMFTSLGKMHNSTQKEKKVDKDQLQIHYDTLTKRWSKDKDVLENFIEAAEGNWYMSPYELSYCTYFHKILSAHQFAKGQLDEWFKKMKETENTRVVMNHGNLSISHFLVNKRGEGVFINLENAQETTPIQDLANYYKNSFKTYPIQQSDRNNWLNMYEKNFSLREEERMLFLSYMAYPTQFASKISKYLKRSEVNNEKDNVRDLLNAYWHMINIEYFVSKIQEDIEAAKSIDDL
ncbi:spore coat protein YsxE [Gottfriedia sp. NPDC057991]|uniref:spore coat protein YsxE n=1 Tax=Gottfriedia sp. NPDC057991 TaxID=3346298 RepID=UPI0036DD7EF5